MLTRLLAATLVLLSSFGAYSEIPDVNDFRVVPQFPQPADTAFGVVGTATPGGRFVLWDGDTVYLQPTLGSDELTPIATGYLGDPGFLAVAPNGYTLLMGAGFSPMVYLLDLRNPVDYTAGDEITAPSHYSGGYLNSHLIVLDRTTDDFMSSELVVLDLDLLTAPTLTRGATSFHSVLTFPQPDTTVRDTIVEKPAFSYAGKLYITPNRTKLYAMDSNTRELREFLVADFIDAFENSTTLDWATDGTLIGAAGDFLSGGVIGKNPDGELIIDGSEGFNAPGGVMYIDPTDPAMILATLDPAGTSPYYNAIYNRALDEVIAIDATWGHPLEAYARETAIAPVPPRNPCDSFTDIFAQWNAFTLENGLNPATADIDADGLPDKAVLFLIKSIACGANSNLKTSTLVAYDLNLDEFDTETDAVALADYRELLSLLMIISQDMQTALPLLLNDSALSLDNTYTRVTCTSGDCLPLFEEKTIATLQVGLRATDEPYSSTGDLDSDGTTNITEYNNVIAKGGNNSDFALAATSSNLDGSSTLRGHASSSGCFIATAAYGTPLATEIDVLRNFRDAHLLTNPLGTAFVDTYYRVSPPIADQVALHPMLRQFVQMALAPVLFIVKLMNTSIAFTLIGIALPFIWIAARFRKKKSTSRTNA